MPRALPISNDYPADWPEINQRVVEAAGRRCIRCGHPYVKGTHGKGEWSPCDEKCTHRGPHAFQFEGGELVLIPTDLPSIELQRAAKKSPVVFPKFVVAQWRILTVHHFSGDKANCEWWNLLALCQRCHLTIQTRVNPQQPYMFEHSDWLKPFVAGFYAMKYEGKNITREEAVARLDQLLAYERIA